MFYLPNVGLKSMVEQGVSNPLVDLLSLEDKTLDEVGFFRVSCSHGSSALLRLTSSSFAGFCCRVMELMQLYLQLRPPPER